MPKPAQVIQMAAAADELLKQLNAKPGEQPPADPNQPAPQDPPAAAAPAPQDPPPAPAQPTPPAEPAAAPTPAAPADDTKAKYDALKQKFDVLKGKYDSEVATLRHDLHAKDERLAALEKLIATLQTQKAAEPAPAEPAKPKKGYIKPEDVEEYGENMIDLAKRAAREAVEPELEQLRAENARLKSQLGETHQAVVGNARDRMHAELDKNIADWRQINVSPAFVAWLKNLDVFSGLQRHQLLLQAYENNDAARVQRFFEAFKREDSATDPTPPAPAHEPVVDKGTLVAPGAPRGVSPGAEAPGRAKKVWTQGEIQEFYDRKRRGKVAPEEAARTERELIEAAAEGRVR